MSLPTYYQEIAGVFEAELRRGHITPPAAGEFALYLALVAAEWLAREGLTKLPDQAQAQAALDQAQAARWAKAAELGLPKK